ncbi:MAG: gephyrin-like molybdotransferase Glp [Dermatophilaceae bacterium]
MRTLDEHLAAILAVVRPLPPTRVPLEQALGLVAAGDAVSHVDLPGFDNSAMDGYAVRTADVAEADPARSGSAVTLPVVLDIGAGDAVTERLRPGQAARIMTGAMLPDGADTVVKVEDTDGGTVLVRIDRGAEPGTWIRRRGEDLARGRLVLTAGSVLTARRIGLLAASGHRDVLVRPRPRVAVVSTGAELVEPGLALAEGQLYDANSYLIAAAVTMAGGRPAYRGSVGDRPDEVLALLTRLAEEVDVIVTSGGVSMGAHDAVKQVLAPLGTVEFVQVAMQPGRPQGFGVLGERQVPVFALPGNPVSSYVSFEVFVRPALRAMLGLDPVVATPVPGRLGAPLRSPDGRRQLARARTQRTPDGWQVEPLAGQGSHFVADLAEADALVVVPESVTALDVGEQVEVLLLDGAGERGAA